MPMPELVVTAVTIQGRTNSEVARDCGLSRRPVHELSRRYETEGEASLQPRSWRPRHSPQFYAVARAKNKGLPTQPAVHQVIQPSVPLLRRLARS